MFILRSDGSMNDSFTNTHIRLWHLPVRTVQYLEYNVNNKVQTPLAHRADDVDK